MGGDEWKSEVFAEFTVHLEGVSPAEVTGTLGIQPSETWVNDENRGGWELNTGKRRMMYTSDAVDEIIGILKPVSSALKQLGKREGVLCFLLTVVVMIRDGDKPAIDLDPDRMRFLAEHDITIEYDYYIYR